jgi:hypothetical protein
VLAPNSLHAYLLHVLLMDTAPITVHGTVPAGWKCRRPFEAACGPQGCQRECADKACNPRQQRLDGRVLVVDVPFYNYRDVPNLLATVMTPARCCQACPDLDECNGWLFCNNRVRTNMQLPGRCHTIYVDITACPPLVSIPLQWCHGADLVSCVLDDQPPTPAATVWPSPPPPITHGPSAAIISSYLAPTCCP